METIERIYTIAAFIALGSLLGLVIKYITRRLAEKGFKRFRSVDLKLMRVHKHAAFVLIIFGTLHGVLSFSKFSEFGLIPYVLGTISLLSSIISAGCFYIKKKFKETKRWIVYHRISALVALATLIGHIALSR